MLGLPDGGVVGLAAGAQWRLLPAGHGKWNSVFKRFSRWCRHDVWQALRAGCSYLPDLQSILIDATVIRAMLRFVSALI